MGQAHRICLRSAGSRRRLRGEHR